MIAAHGALAARLTESGWEVRVYADPKHQTRFVQVAKRGYQARRTEKFDTLADALAHDPVWGAPTTRPNIVDLAAAAA